MVFWAVLPPIFAPLRSLEVEMGESLGNQYIPGATVTVCVFSRRARTPPLSEQLLVLFPSNFGILALFSQGRAGGGGGGGRVG